MRVNPTRPGHVSNPSKHQNTAPRAHLNIYIYIYMLYNKSCMNGHPRRPFDPRIEPPESPTYQPGFYSLKPMKYSLQTRLMSENPSTSFVYDFFQETFFLIHGGPRGPNFRTSFFCNSKHSQGPHGIPGGPGGAKTTKNTVRGGGSARAFVLSCFLWFRLPPSSSTAWGDLHTPQGYLG